MSEVEAVMALYEMRAYTLYVGKMAELEKLLSWPLVMTRR
jgi:hypothetical protein